MSQCNRFRLPTADKRSHSSHMSPCSVNYTNTFFALQSSIFTGWEESTFFSPTPPPHSLGHAGLFSTLQRDRMNSVDLTEGQHNQAILVRNNTNRGEISIVAAHLQLGKGPSEVQSSCTQRGGREHRLETLPRTNVDCCQPPRFEFKWSNERSSRHLRTEHILPWMKI